MQVVKQKTIQSDIKISGIGLHTGNPVDLVLKPAVENTGINFLELTCQRHLSLKRVLKILLFLKGCLDVHL